MRDNTCCFIGHRTIDETEELKARIEKIIEKIIFEEDVDTFLFGSKSRFNTLCYEIVSKIKKKHPHIKRVYVRAEFSCIDDEYKEYLLKFYEDTYYPERAKGSRRAVYIERNYEMINRSRFCVVYYNKEKTPVNRKSGTEIALNYATKQGKNIIMLPM